MPYGTYISAEGARVQSLQLETISNNLANVNTTGFKRDLARIQARHAEAIQRGLDYAGSRSLNDIGGGVQVRDTVIDFSPGIYETTGRRLDFAVSGDGFFVVLKNEQEFLTRAGNFQFNSSGQLTTDQGDPVLSRRGVPIQLNPTEPYEVTTKGQITQAGEVYELALVIPRSLADLTKAGGNLFSSQTNTEPVKSAQRQILSGSLEKSSVNPISELTKMIEASRAFEANIKLIQNQDDMLGSLINRVLATR